MGSVVGARFPVVFLRACFITARVRGTRESNVFTDLSFYSGGGGANELTIVPLDRVTLSLPPDRVTLPLLEKDLRRTSGRTMQEG